MIDSAPPVHRTITQQLGIRGWSHLDPIILAALATDSPLLLVGSHGTGKSLLVERIALALDLPMRHYNASLLNYDDLVGIPMPDSEGKSLEFITSPGTIWDAGFAFFDEISRCRTDLQNKLFPIIHERKVIGIPLSNLRHRWAAMNPPAPQDLNLSDASAVYLGSEPLDPALVDRFPFVVTVPDWSQLSTEDRANLINLSSVDQMTVINLNLPDLINDCVHEIERITPEISTWIHDYVLSVMDFLDQAELPQSPRRAHMLARNVIAVHAARTIIEGNDGDISRSAEIALCYSMPQTATDVPPSTVKIVALHRQAWQLTEYLDDDAWRQVMSEYDGAKRVALADELGFSDEDMSRLITQTIGKEDSNSRQIGLAVAMLLAFKDRRNLDPSAFEPIAQLAYHILSPRRVAHTLQPNSDAEGTWLEIRSWIENQHDQPESFLFRLRRNFLLHGIPTLWRNTKWQEALYQFDEDLKLFGIQEEAMA